MRAAAEMTVIIGEQLDARGDATATVCPEHLHTSRAAALRTHLLHRMREALANFLLPKRLMAVSAEEGEGYELASEIIVEEALKLSQALSE